MIIKTKYQRLVEWEQRDQTWRNWFAWYPVEVEEGYVWLQTIERMRWLHHSMYSGHHKGYIYRTKR